MVNQVGVEVNTASVSLLKYVAGISADVARKIVEQRPIASREQLKTIKGVGPKAYTQAAGFLRIESSDNALDNTSVHPESYSVVSELCRIIVGDMGAAGIATDVLKHLKLPLEDLKNGKGENTIEHMAKRLRVGAPTLCDIIDALLMPARDIRGKPCPGTLRTVYSGGLRSLSPGQVVEGTVRNVVDYGAFVDIGVGKDGLVHFSKVKMVRNQFTKLTEHLTLGARVIVRVERVDLIKGHITLCLMENMS